MTRWIAVALALVLVMATTAGCDKSDGTDETTSREAVSSATVETTAAALPDGASGETGSATSGTTGVSGTAEEDALQAELEAIQRELDAMVLPDDTDFGAIEGALQ
ncbi:MAG: hypothetical protein Q7W51_10600 [Coriobacteriia bacterium]|nr:hypothetical protein [Coriobacteriia bacterium]